MKKEAVSFRATIQPGEKRRLFERVKWNGSVHEVRVRFYPGPEGALHVQPYIQHKAEQIENMFTYAGETDGYISGDDDYFVYPVHVPVETDDKIAVFAYNTDANYAYTLSVDVIVGYEMEVIANGTS